MLLNPNQVSSKHAADQRPSFRHEASSSMIPSTHSFLVGMPGSIASLAHAAAQFSTDRRPVYSQEFGYFSLFMSHFQ
jgi:hypothetical protein